MKEADMAIHGSQDSFNGIRQPKPRKKYTVPRFRVTIDFTLTRNSTANSFAVSNSLLIVFLSGNTTQHSADHTLLERLSELP
jgi:hypothetical protein